MQAHPIAYVSQRMANGHLFIPTRHAHGESADTLPAHRANCDVCAMTPIVGTRWKCSTCPDYDMCDGCYQTKRKQHGHTFMHIPEPDEVTAQRITGFGGGYGLMGFRMASNFTAPAPGEWDHSIFVADAQVLAPQFHYDSLETQNVEFSGTHFCDRLAQMLGLPALKLRYLNKMIIVGRGYGNRDYIAAEYEIN